MVMMWIIGVMNWHMGRLRRGQKWSNDGSEGACQPHIDDHATENDDEVNRIPSEMEVAPRCKLLTLLTLLTLIRSLRPIVRQLVNGFFLNCINYIGQAEGTLHRVGNASFWPCHHRAMHKSNTPFLQKYTNRSCAKV